MKQIAAPMVGGLITSTILTLVIIPAVYGLVVAYKERRAFEREQRLGAPDASLETF